MLDWAYAGDYKMQGVQLKATGCATIGQQGVVGADSPSSEVRDNEPLGREALVAALSLDSLSGDMFTELMELVGITTGCPQ